ncbi:hypothetical protein HY745_09025, partial [Candidatus Desantisbacteria bacterium]|nr:hypothetical protein [Candidatus Desantisbacteria bacterium]
RVQANGTVTKIAPAYNFSNPNALSFDSNNRLLVAEAGNSILRIDLNTNNVETLATGFGIPQAVLEYNNNIYFTDNQGYLYRIQPSDILPITFPAISNRYISYLIVGGSQGGMVIHPNGNIYASDYNGNVVMVSINTKTVTVIFNYPGFQTRGLALSPDKMTLIVTGYNSNEIAEIDLLSNYASILTNNSVASNKLAGPFGIVVSNINFPNFIKP